MNAAKWIFLSIFGVFFSLILIGLMLPRSATTVNSATLDPALTEYIPPLIRKMGMRCGTLSRMTLHTKTERGDVFKAVCDEATHFYRYRMLYTPTGNMTVQPWSE